MGFDSICGFDSSMEEVLLADEQMDSSHFGKNVHKFRQVF